ncbi:hypothetical protein AVEN_162641-1 [Araneus ventricosus]|uniref:Uncharacterized protein n=1 Tax=Araneus ventricosus TaxID=182803 RepID=A0A4Y2FCM6_ARAVE|nr:hypothetical protein AVEN_162641-1 [Araneus ventricosus]
MRRFKVPDLLPPALFLPHTGDFRVYFLSDLASSRGPDLGSGFVFPLPSHRGVERPSEYSNLISNYSEFQHFQFSTPNFIGFYIDERFFFPVFQKSWRGTVVNVPLYDRGGLVIRSRLQDQRVPGSIPDPTEDSPCMWTCCALNHTLGGKRPPASVVQMFGQKGMPAHLLSLSSDLTPP